MLRSASPVMVTNAGVGNDVRAVTITSRRVTLERTAPHASKTRSPRPLDVPRGSSLETGLAPARERSLPIVRRPRYSHKLRARGTARFDSPLSLIAVCSVVIAGCEAHDQVLPWRPATNSSGVVAQDAAAPTTTAPLPVTGSPSTASPPLVADGSSPAATSDAGAEPLATPGADASIPGTEAGPMVPTDAGGTGPSEPPKMTAPTAKDPDCDMNGIWAVRQVTRSEALLTGQFANNFFYFEFSQNGEEVVATKHLNCALVILGSATGRATRATADAIRSHNSQVGRKGTMSKASDGCHFEMERWWYARGVDEPRFLPKPRNAKVSLAQVQAELPLPTPARPDGAQDWENDGKLGMAVTLTGIIGGIRNSATRDFTDWYTDSARPIPPALDWRENLRVVARFEGEENLFDPTTGLLAQLATVDVAAKNTLTMHFLGRTVSDPRAAAVVRPDSWDTCQALQALLPEKDSLDY